MTVELVRDLYLDSFIAALAVGIAAPWLGTYLVLRRLPFLAVAIPQMAGAGLALSFLVWGVVFAAADEAHHPADLEGPPRAFQLALSTCTVAAGLGILALVGRQSRNTGTHAAVAFLMAFAAAEIFLLESPYEEVGDQMLHHGRLLAVLPAGRNLVLAASAVFAIAAVALRRGLWLSAFDSDQTRLAGRSPGLLLFATLGLLGGFSALTVPEVGPEVVLSLMVIPPVVLHRLTPSLAAYGPLCSAAGVLGAAASFLLAVGEDWPIGPALTLSVLGTSLLMAAVLKVCRLPRRRDVDT